MIDIAKIEPGQFTLNMSEQAIDSVVDAVPSATEPLAQNKKRTLKTEVAKTLPRRGTGRLARCASRPPRRLKLHSSGRRPGSVGAPRPHANGRPDAGDRCR